MNAFQRLSLVVAILAAGLWSAPALAAPAEGSEKLRTFTSGEAIASAGLLVKLSSGKAVKCGAGQDAIGISHSVATGANELIAVKLLKPTGIMTSAGTISIGDDVYAAASGQVGTTVSGQRVGVALSATTTSALGVEVAYGLSQKGNISADTISEITATAGVTIDGVKCKDYNCQAGASGSAGYFSAFPATAAKGSLKVSAADSAGDTVTTVTNASQAAARTYTIPDGGGNAEFVLNAGAQTIAGTKTFSSTTLTSAVFLSAEVTGNGSAQSTAHGLAVVPSVVIAIPSDLTGGAFAVVYGTHTTTNAVVTATNGEKYKVLCIR